MGEKEEFLNAISIDIEQINGVRKGIGNLAFLRVFQEAMRVVSWVVLICYLAIMALFIAKLFGIETERFFKYWYVFAIVVVIYLFGVMGMNFYKKKKLAPVEIMVKELQFKIMKMINPSFEYFADSYIDVNEYSRSEMFSSGVDVYSGESLIKGSLGHSSFRMSYVKSQRHDSDNNSYKTLFKGIFLITEFNKKFSGKTIILQDVAENALGNVIGTWLQKKNIMQEELVKLEDTEFEEKFVVYATNQIEARYLLSPTMMEKLNILHDKYNGIMMSFVDSKMYVAFPGLSRFGIEIEYEDLIDSDSVWESYQEMKNMIDFIETIVNELGLNNRIYIDDTIK